MGVVHLRYLSVLLIAMLLVGILSTNYSAFAAKDDTHPTRCADLKTFEQIIDCLRNAANEASQVGALRGVKDAITALINAISGEHNERKTQDTILQNQINSIKLLPGPQGPPGTINAQLCPPGEYVAGIAPGGTLICTTPPSGTSFSICGDGIVQSTEQCDSGGIDTATCNGFTCNTAVCGDGYINTVAGEQCDRGGANSDSGTCTASCQFAVCGDGLVNKLGIKPEQCDSGGIDTATCNGFTCNVAVCGDGYVNAAAGEQCDMGLLNSDAQGSLCNASCKIR